MFMRSNNWSLLNMNGKNIYVTQPFLPKLEEFIPFLEKIWDRKVLTNGGEFHQALEYELCKYLGVKYLSLFCNGTIALVTALQALGVKGEIITTPYSFVATTHSIWWNGLEPVFVDVDRTTMNIDPTKIEKAITPRTAAILPVHCYGQPCAVDAIQKIANDNNLRVIYDAAHAFGVKLHNNSVLNYGDLSVLSFHATKVFNTFEGGAIVCHDAKTKQKIDNLKNFGIVDETTVVATGINGKMSELNASFGLLQLRYVDQIIKRRTEIAQLYSEQLSGVSGIKCLEYSQGVVANYGYFPIKVTYEYPLSRDGLYNKLKKNSVYARRYFYPLISEFPTYCDLPSANADNLAVAHDLSSKVLCLPIYPDLGDKQILSVVKLIKAKRKS